MGLVESRKKSTISKGGQDRLRGATIFLVHFSQLRPVVDRINSGSTGN